MLNTLVAEVESNNAYDYLKKLTDAVRVHVFDTAMHFQAIFEDEEEGETRTAGGKHVNRAGKVLHTWAL